MFASLRFAPPAFVLCRSLLCVAFLRLASLCFALLCLVMPRLVLLSAVKALGWLAASSCWVLSWDRASGLPRASRLSYLLGLLQYSGVSITSLIVCVLQYVFVYLCACVKLFIDFSLAFL